VPYVFNSRSSIFWPLLLATAVTMYRTDSYARDDTYYKWHYEKMYNCVHLGVALVLCHNDRFVFLWIKARENSALMPVNLGEIFTADTRWICWWDKYPEVRTNEGNYNYAYSHPHPLIFTESTLSVVVFSISVVKLANSCFVALNGNVKLTLSSINSTNCTYMWVHLNTSDVQPSRHELHEQFNNPVKSSRRDVTHSVGRSMKLPASVDSAGSKRQIVGD
jgi:hypothetical protein